MCAVTPLKATSNNITKTSFNYQDRPQLDFKQRRITTMVLDVGYGSSFSPAGGAKKIVKPKEKTSSSTENCRSDLQVQEVILDGLQKISSTKEDVIFGSSPEEN